MFDIYNILTYDEVPDGLAVIEGEIIYDNDGNPMKWRDFTSLIKSILNFLNRNGDDYTLTKEQLIAFLHRFTKEYKSELKTINIVNQEITTKDDNSSYFKPYSRDSNMTSYEFSLAQKEFVKYLSNENQEKLKNIIINHFNQHEKKYRLQQEIFDNQILIDNYLFSDLCYCNSLEDEQDIIYEYFTAFEDLESLEYIDELLNNDYLNQYPELKKNIKISLIKYQLKN